jgi:hypothetical protein
MVSHHPLHQLVGITPDEHRTALIHELRPIVVQLVVHDPLGVIDAPVQSHVETEGEEAHGVGFYERPNAQATEPSTQCPTPVVRFSGAPVARFRYSAGAVQLHVAAVAARLWPGASALRASWLPAVRTSGDRNRSAQLNA